MVDFSISQPNLRTYSLYGELHPLRAACLMLGFDPIYYERQDFEDRHASNVKLLADLLKQLAKKGEFKGVTIGEEIYLNGVKKYIKGISTAELKLWALSNGYQWLGETIDPAEELNFKAQIKEQQQQRDLQEEVNDLKEQLSQAQAENAELLAEVERLGETKDNANNEFCIDGHTTEALQAIPKVIKRFWKNADLSQADTIENKDTIIKWIQEYCGLSQNLAIAVQAITRPKEARSIGSKGNNKKG